MRSHSIDAQSQNSRGESTVAVTEGNPRRIVTGQRADGTSFFARVAEAEILEEGTGGGREVWRVWGAEQLPVRLPTDGQSPQGAQPGVDGERAFLSQLPSPEGMRFTLVRYQPGWKDPLYAVDTADIVIVLDGELVYALDGGEEVVVRHGDVVVQNGVKKSWQNRSDRPAMIAAAVLGATVDGAGARA
jgi:quercetin dioxygenase-like cupin family protein